MFLKSQGPCPATPRASEHTEQQGPSPERSSTLFHPVPAHLEGSAPCDCGRWGSRAGGFLHLWLSPGCGGWRPAGHLRSPRAVVWARAGPLPRRVVKKGRGEKWGARRGLAGDPPDAARQLVTDAVREHLCCPVATGHSGHGTCALSPDWVSGPPAPLPATAASPAHTPPLCPRPRRVLPQNRRRVGSLHGPAPECHRPLRPLVPGVLAPGASLSLQVRRGPVRLLVSGRH